MVDVRRPARRLFYLLLSVIAAVGMSQVSLPAEAATGPAMTTVNEAIASRDIVNEDDFKAGLSKVIDGTVQCLNASSWAKGK